MKELNFIFDKIYLISLDLSPRRSLVKKKLDGVDYELFSGINGATIDKDYYVERGSKLTRGQMGCSLSHVTIYDDIVLKNYQRPLILEDDFVVTESFGLLQQVFAELPEDWNFFYLGHYNCPDYFRISDHLAEVSPERFACLHGTHAISLNPQTAKILADLNRNLHFTADGCVTQATKTLGLRCHAAMPPLIDQDLSLQNDTVEIDLKFN